MRASNFRQRRLAGLDFIRLNKSFAAGATPQRGAVPGESLAVSAKAMPGGVPTMGPGCAVRAVAQIEGVLFQPEAGGDYTT